ncbi:MAG: electron transport complex subunit E [Myxococcales bacterium]|nr:electron transport complex subunit E [Myxococcales bacterium]
MSLWKDLTNGIVAENPTFRLVLGMCPTLATSTNAKNGIGMGIAATFVLVCSNILISALRNVIPNKVRIPAYIVVIAAFVTIVDLSMNAYFHQLYKALGIFIPLIVVNCIILGRAEAFANRNPVLNSALDGIGMGIGFTLALTAIGSVREILGNGTVFGIPVLTALADAAGGQYVPIIVMILPPGAFLCLGSMLAVINRLTRKEAK